MIVTVYSDVRYGGEKQELAVGKFPAPFGKVLAKQISSVQVTPGYELTLYESADYTGKRRSITADAPNLTAIKFNDVASSAEVRAIVTVYESPDYQGASQLLGVGRYSDPKAFGPVGNDKISSVKVAPGYELVVYEGTDFAGKRRTLTADTPKFEAITFDNMASSAEIRRVPASLEPKGGDWQLTEHFDDEELKYRVARDPIVITRLAQLANVLGFAWCGGTDADVVGQGFDVYRDGDTYVAQARYHDGDLYVKGPEEKTRLKITLSNFRVLIDPTSLVFSNALIKELTPVAVQTQIAYNEGGKDDTAKTAFEYWRSTTVTHESSRSITAGGKVSVGYKWSAGVKLGAVGVTKEISVGVEFSISGEHSWGSSEAELESAKMTHEHSASLPPRSKRTITLIAASTESQVDYKATGVVQFDFAFEGFLRGMGNAYKGKPDHRPMHKTKFGIGTGTEEPEAKEPEMKKPEARESEILSGQEHALDMYEHRHIPAYSDWDWDWSANYRSHELDSAVEFLRGRILVEVHGRFSNVKKGTHVQTIAGPSVPLDAVAPPPNQVNPDANSSWVHVPLLKPAADLAVAANGSVWATTTDGTLYWRDPAGVGWRHVHESTGASRVAVDGAGTAWVVTKGGGLNRVFLKHDSFDIGTAPAQVTKAVDIGVNANDNVWVIAADPAKPTAPPAILQLNGTSWKSTGGEAVSISVAPNGGPWAANSINHMWVLVSGVWKEDVLTQDITDLAWAPGTTPVLWTAKKDGTNIRKWSESGWEPARAGAAVRIAVDPKGLPWRIDQKGDIYRLVP